MKLWMWFVVINRWAHSETAIYLGFYCATLCWARYITVYATAIPSVCLSVRPSHVYCIKTAEHIIEILSLSDRPGHHCSFSSPRVVAQIWRLHPQWERQIQGGSSFRQIRGYISETVIDRRIVTIEYEYKLVCALSNSAAFDDLEWPRTPVSRSQYSLKANISQTVHPMHSMFGSRLGFSESANRMALFAVR